MRENQRRQAAATLEADNNTSFIQGVLGKYIYDFEEHKRRKAKHLQS